MHWVTLQARVLVIQAATQTEQKIQMGPILCFFFLFYFRFIHRILSSAFFSPDT